MKANKETTVASAAIPMAHYSPSVRQSHGLPTGAAMRRRRSRSFSAVRTPFSMTG